MALQPAEHGVALYRASRLGVGTKQLGHVQVDGFEGLADSYADAARETGLVVLIGHHLVLSVLLGLDVLRALRDEKFEAAAVLVVGWRVVATGLLGTVCVLLCWAWSLTHSRSEVLAFALTVVVELSVSVPFYARNVERIFEA